MDGYVNRQANVEARLKMKERYEMITVFTPTYNRAHTLQRLYESLKSQTYKNFEWLVVDDGSMDSTADLIEAFQRENVVDIRYFYVTNGGKHRAINFGVQRARGELFFIVDSDDYLPSNGLETIWKYWSSLEDKESYAGVVFRKCDIGTGKVIGPELDEKEFDSNCIDFANKYGSLDKAEVFLTNVLKNYRFPEIEGEKFVPEGFMWDIISSDRKMRFVDQVVYFCEYMEDGYTKNFKKNFMSNPKGFRVAYKYILTNKQYKLSRRLKAFIRFIQSYYYDWRKAVLDRK